VGLSSSLIRRDHLLLHHRRRFFQIECDGVEQKFHVPFLQSQISRPEGETG
jgi:hypothetical protein